MNNETCPANIEKVIIVDFPFKGKNYRLCQTYENLATRLGFLPNMEYCPDCQYNSVRVRKQAENDISKKV